MTAFALLFTLAAIGVSETVYLIKKRKMLERPVCIVGDDCSKVLESKYNKILGIHNDILGLVFYLTASFITAFLVIEVESLRFWTLSARLMIFSGAVFSLYLTYLQWRVIRAWCFWCLMSAVTVFLMLIVILLAK